MSPDQLKAPSVEDIQAAVQITLQNLAKVLLNSEASGKDRLRRLGDYMICWVINNENSSNEVQQDSLIEGLTVAGVDRSLVEKINKAAQTRTVIRSVASLRYIPDTEEVRGILRNPKSSSLDRAEFIQGILEKDRASSQ